MLAAEYGLTAEQMAGLERHAATLAACTGLSEDTARCAVQGAIRGEWELWAAATGRDLSDKALALYLFDQDEPAKAQARYAALREEVV